jgi:DNA-binding NarL/FixJ family response regulator
VEWCGGEAVAVIDDHDAIHTAVELWCRRAEPPIPFARSCFSVHEFLAEFPFGLDSEVCTVVFDPEWDGKGVDFDSLNALVQRHYRVIIYSDVDTDEIILTCLDLGAATYVVKSEGHAHLINAIRASKSNTPYVAPRMEKAILNDRAVGRPNLGPREKEVLRAWLRTESKDQVARQLSVSTTTVNTHLQRVRAKYAAVGRPAATKAALVARAIQDGIITANDL